MSYDFSQKSVARKVLKLIILKCFILKAIEKNHIDRLSFYKLKIIFKKKKKNFPSEKQKQKNRRV
jgi:hypothetical protein